jgi:hypothetical protein
VACLSAYSTTKDVLVDDHTQRRNYRLVTNSSQKREQSQICHVARGATRAGKCSPEVPCDSSGYVWPATFVASNGKPTVGSLLERQKNELLRVLVFKMPALYSTMSFTSMKICKPFSLIRSHDSYGVAGCGHQREGRAKILRVYSDHSLQRTSLSLALCYLCHSRQQLASGGIISQSGEDCLPKVVTMGGSVEKGQMTTKQ